MLNVEVVKYRFVNIFLPKFMKRCLLGVEFWSPLRSTVCTCSGSGGSNGKQRGHVLVCLYGTFSDLIAIYLPLVLLCVVCI